MFYNIGLYMCYINYINRCIGGELYFISVKVLNFLGKGIMYSYKELGSIIVKVRICFKGFVSLCCMELFGL